MSKTTTTEKPIRAGVFSNIYVADRAVQLLVDEGFTHDEISVLCSDETKEQYFREFEHQQPAGTNTPAAAAICGTVGAAVGGIAAATAGMAIGDIAPLIMGSAAAATGGVLGGFVGAMMTRGGERELANFYNQSVVEGKIVVAVDVQGPDAEARLAHAAEILADTGSESVPLREG